MNSLCLPCLKTDNPAVNKAFRIAVGNIISNIVPYKAGLLESEKPVIMAGLDYVTPWTRDAAINTWNGAGILFPEITLNTLLSVIETRDKQVMVSGQYWDAIIWTLGAWWQYLYTGDKQFLLQAYDVVNNSLEYFEQTEFDTSLNLFRGPAVYGDGVAAYPDIYAQTGGSSGIYDWPQNNRDQVSKPGYGIPMHALSTNCVYYYSYVIADRMATELGMKNDGDYPSKAKQLKKSINRHFWNVKNGRYDYLVDSFGGCNHMEGLGHSFAILFGIAGTKQVESILKNQFISPSGIPCVWPTFERYMDKTGKAAGRHSGTIWPHIQAFWAHACMSAGKERSFRHELDKLTEHAVRDNQFVEIYHPISGEVYGGIQEDKGKGIREWKSCSIQTWSATGYIRMILMGLMGMDFATNGINFRPYLVEGMESINLSLLRYRGMKLSISIEGHGHQIVDFRIDGTHTSPYFLDADGTGEREVYIRVSSGS